MSLSDSSSQSSSDCDDCLSDFDMEVEESGGESEEIHAYADEPLADEEWLKTTKEKKKTRNWSKPFKLNSTAQTKWDLGELREYSAVVLWRIVCIHRLFQAIMLF